MSACHQSELSGTCAPISSATRVEVRAGHFDYVISDPVRVRDLVAFANGRREASQSVLYTPPAPQTTAAFYEGNHFLGAFGVGSDFFFVSCEKWKGTRSATLDEITSFQMMLHGPEGKSLPGQKK
jgi:hypothetical protein